MESKEYASSMIKQFMHCASCMQELPEDSTPQDYVWIEVGINYDDMINIAMSDNRLGNSHWSVPGHDGKRGYGGSCLPKDVSALYSDMINLEIVSYIINL